MIEAISDLGKYALDKENIPEEERLINDPNPKGMDGSIITINLSKSESAFKFDKVDGVTRQEP